MKLIESADGTRIALDRPGSGPPLVIVLGAFCDRSTSRPLAALLAASYTVYEYDRRGRGDSGNGLPLSVEGEVRDLAAVVAAAGQPPFVYGHSSGGALALEAAARGWRCEVSPSTSRRTRATIIPAPRSADASTNSWPQDTVTMRPSNG